VSDTIILLMERIKPTSTSTPYLRVPPQSLEMEMALLGSVMLRPDVINEFMDFINFQMFYSEKHRIIYKTMLELFQKSTPIDLLSLSSALRDKSLLEQIGGAAYLTELVNTVPSAANAKHYAEIVQKKAIMRNLIECSEDLARLGYDESSDLEVMLDQAEKRVFEVTNFSTAHRFVQLNETLADAWERLDRLSKSTNELRGVHTGFKELDNKLAGFQKSDLIILAARPSMGKTSLALDIARMSSINHGTPVGIFSLEMSSQQLVDRMLAAESRIDSWKLRTGKQINENDFDAMRIAIDKLSKAPIFIDDTPGTNILKMRSVARRLKSEKGLGLLIVDYLQLMQPTTAKNNDNVVQQVTEISRSLKQLARELEVPVIALSQLSRAVEQRGGKPRLSDLRDSGSIEQDADVVMFIHREDRMLREESTKPNIAEIMIEKHRNGATGTVELFFDGARTTFLSIEKSNFGGTNLGNDDF
jgi:replicative DNA helicase